MADHNCQNKATICVLSAGRTSRAVKHLRVVHQITSPCTEICQEIKRKREANIERLRSSTLFVSNPKRFNLLLETLRIVNNNLPISSVEYEETKLKEELLMQDTMRTTISRRLVSHSIVELYVSAKNEVIKYLDASRMHCPSFSMMADFWTCKVTSEKYLGLRVYLVDSEWKMRSVLLGTRKFTPPFGDRATGIQQPFHVWTKKLLEDFDLTTASFYGATNDKGGDVRSMLSNEFRFQWEWCVAHMLHAATKAACGMNGDITT